MTKTPIFLAALLFPFPADADAAARMSQPRVPVVLRETAPELLACLIVMLAAMAMAYIGLRRSIVSDERARALQQQLAAEREARGQADQALAANHDVLCRLVRQQEGVRAGERTRIARDLQAELGGRLLALRGELSRLNHAPCAAPPLVGKQVGELVGELDGALARVDGALGAVRAVAGGLRGFGPGDGLRHALERCLAEHAHAHGLRYRFEAGVDPASRASQDRAARLAVFRVLQDVLARAARVKTGGELHVRLVEGASSLGLEIDGCAATEGADAGAVLPHELVEHIRAIGGVLRIVSTTQHQGRWSLSVPVQPSAAPPARASALAQCA